MPDDAELFLYSEIGPEWAGMVSDVALINSLGQLKSSKRIHLHINSPGGDAMMGISMANALNRHPAKIIAHVDALAASAATIAAMGADKIIMHPGSLFVIHNAMTIQFGNQQAMLKAAEVLGTVDRNIIDMYHRRSGLDKAKIQAMMTEETWMTPQDAVQLGFADETDSTDTGVTASIPNGWFNKAPATVGRYTPDTRKAAALTGISIAAKVNPQDTARKALWESRKKQLLAS